MQCAHEGELYALQPEAGGSWRADVGAFDTEHISTTSSFLINPPNQPCELVAFQCVVDVSSGLHVPVAAFRSGSGSGPTSYSFGHIDASAGLFTCWQHFPITSTAVTDRTQVELCDGPVLCVLRSFAREGRSELIFAKCDDSDSGDDASRPGVRTVVLPWEAPQLLCACRLSSHSSEVSLLLHARTDDKAHVVACPISPHPQQSQLPRPPSPSPFHTVMHSPALVSMAAAVSCVAPQWVHRPGCAPHQPGMLESELQLWIGTTTAMLHLCSLDGSAVSSPHFGGRVRW